MSTDSIVLILIGPAGSGKGTVAAYLRNQHSIPVVRYSTIFREILAILRIEETRPELSNISLGLRNLYGEDVLAAPVSYRIDDLEEPIVVLDGARRKPDITALTSARKQVIVYIEATAEERFDRITARTENADDATKTLESFKTDEAHDTEITIPPLKAMADYVLVNDGTLEELYAKIDDLLDTL